jgi:hypothetical protein
MDSAEIGSFIIMRSFDAGEATCPQSCSLETVAVLSPVYTDVIGNASARHSIEPYLFFKTALLWYSTLCSPGQVYRRLEENTTSIIRNEMQD